MFWPEIFHDFFLFHDVFVTEVSILSQQVNQLKENTCICRCHKQNYVSRTDLIYSNHVFKSFKSLNNEK